MVAKPANSLNVRKESLISFKISASDKQVLKEASRIAGVSQTEFVLKESLARARKILGQTDLHHIEPNPRFDGGFRFVGRKLAVFQNYLLLESSPHSDQDWADMYGLPLAAIVEARLVCTRLHNEEYNRWREATLAQDAEDDELYGDD